jgi:UDP:flavonoid glycosyltransferase YjiC (YdhE family)
VFRPGAQVPARILEHNENAVLSNVNSALERLRLPPLAALQDVLSGAQQFVTSFPELDHYDGTRTEPFIGLPDCAHGIDPPWPGGDGPRVLAYLRPSKDLEVTLTALARMPARVLVRVGGINPERLKSFERPGMALVDQPVHMRRAAESCDAFVNYASHGVTAEMLLAGRPGLLLPDNLERSLVARRATQLGACLAPPEKGDFNLSQALARLLGEAALGNAARVFAQRYHHVDRAQILPRMTDLILKKL